MKAWFLALTERERYLVILGGGFLLLVLLWFVAWQPLMKYQKRLQLDLEASSEDLVYLQQAQRQLTSRQAASEKPEFDTNTSVQLIISPLLQQYGLNQGDVLERSEAKGKDGVNLRLKGAQFDQLMHFLGDLETQHGIYVTSMSLIPAETPGLTSAQLTLER